MIISLDVKDNKAKAFIEFLKNLDFVTIERSELTDEEHISLINERLEEYHLNPQKTTELSKKLLELKTKYGL